MMTKYGWKYYYHLRKLHSFSRKVISKKKLDLKTEKNDKKGKFLDLIDILLLAKVKHFYLFVNIYILYIYIIYSKITIN